MGSRKLKVLRQGGNKESASSHEDPVVVGTTSEVPY